MNERVKYRGLTKDSKWVYGFYFKTPLTDESTGSKPEDGWFFLSGKERHCIAQNGCVYEVIPETVGQFIGLFDSNKEEIYEADVVLIDGYTAVIQWDVTTSRFIIGLIDENVVYDFDSTYPYELEIIGSVHEIRLKEV